MSAVHDRAKRGFAAARRQFGAAGLALSVLAVLFAMLGGAYAATHPSKGKYVTKPEAVKIAEQYAGKPGAAGPIGPEGKQGPSGSNGTNGTSVAVTTISSGGSSCEGRPGAEVKQEGAASGVEVCDGATGFTETLPPGSSEHGVFARAVQGEAQAVDDSISFPIWLKQPIPNDHTQLVREGQQGTEGCAGGTVAHPLAQPGWFCAYVGTHPKGAGGSDEEHVEACSPNCFHNMEAEAGQGAGKSGAVLAWHSTGGGTGGEARLVGVWVVTAPTEPEP